MAVPQNQLAIARQKLCIILGDRFKLYMNCLKLWFSQKVNKEDFDNEARKLLSKDGVRAHNEFLLAFFNKCQDPLPGRDWFAGSSSSQHRDKVKKGKLNGREKPVRVTFEKRFVPATRHVPSVRESADRSLSFCLREACLADPSMLHGRIFVIAWECGVEDIHEHVIPVVLQALRFYLRGVLMDLLSRRRAYKLRERVWRHGMGGPPRNPYLRANTACTLFSQGHSRAIAESRAVFEVANDPPPSKRSRSSSDLVNALQARWLPSHSTHCQTLEGSLCRQWHPSHAQLRQELIRGQEEALRSQLAEQQRNMSWR